MVGNLAEGQATKFLCHSTHFFLDYQGKNKYFACQIQLCIFRVMMTQQRFSHRCCQLGARTMYRVARRSAPRKAIAYVAIKVGSFSYPTALQPAEHFINLSTIYSLRGTEPPWRFMGMWVGVVARM